MEIIILFLIAYLSNHAHAQDKIHIAANLPNLMSAMTGYNIIKGNPFSMNAVHDPGFLASYIFKPFVESANGIPGEDPTLHPGVTVRNIRQCDLSLSTDTITTMTEYQRQVTKETTAGLDFASNVEADVQASVQGVGIDTTIPPLIKSSFSASNSFRESEKFFSQKKGVITINDATCTVYTAHISAYNPPPFSASFLQALYHLNLASTKSEIEKDREFFRFIDNFGTHFLSHATMGARLAITRKYTTQEFTKSKDDAIKNCNVQQLSMFFGHQADLKHDHCKNLETSSTSKIENVYEREFISTYGSKPSRDLVDWSNQDFQDPLPIRMTLRPILNLFSTTYMNQAGVSNLNIDHQAVLKWIAPRYYNFCEKYKNTLGVATCDAPDVKGCGWSDTCNRRTEKCIDDTTDLKGYKCCKAEQCSPNPCQHGTCQHTGTCSFKCHCYDGYSGDKCQYEKLTENKLEVSVDLFVTNYQKLNHAALAAKLNAWLTNRFALNRFSSVVYDDVFGYWEHKVVGPYHYSNFREYGHNIVVGYTSRVPYKVYTKSTKRAFSGYLLSYLNTVGCNARDIVSRAQFILDVRHIRYSMIFASSDENDVRPVYDDETALILNYLCSSSEKATVIIVLE